MSNSPIGTEGSIRQENGSTIVEVQGSTHLATAAGVECINPTAAENERIYQRFLHRNQSICTISTNKQWQII